MDRGAQFFHIWTDERPLCSGTLFHATKLPLTTWFQAICLGGCPT